MIKGNQSAINLQNMYPAKWWKNTDNGIRCLLCSRNCIILDGNSGYCGIRRNINGKLYALSYGRPVALQVDPIEKKPLAEFMPRTWTFSLGTYGCNLGCVFCQNHHLSRGFYTDSDKTEHYSAETIVQMAKRNNCQSIAFTYNEPLVWAEYVIDIAKIAKKEGLATVLVSNAYVSREAAEEILPNIDAANFDMKGFSEDFYKGMTGAELQPVLNTVEYFYSLNKHLEITNLVIPGKNDTHKMIDDYLSWVADKLDKNIPLHFSAYHPDYKFSESSRTSPDVLYNIKTKANAEGFGHIYLGNVF